MHPDLGDGRVVHPNPGVQDQRGVGIQVGKHERQVTEVQGGRRGDELGLLQSGPGQGPGGGAGGSQVARSGAEPEGVQGRPTLLHRPPNPERDRGCVGLRTPSHACQGVEPEGKGG